MDLSPIQPSLLVPTLLLPSTRRADLTYESVPPNCSFEVDDLEKDWTWSKPFDFIMSRVMAGSFSDYETYIKKAYE